MATVPVTFGSFGGLRMDIDAIDVGASHATDGVNVDLERPGQVRTRDGNTLVKSIANESVGGGLAAYSSSLTAIPQLIVIYQDLTLAWKLEAYPADGGAVIASATPGAHEVFAARWGDPTNTRLYIGDSTGIWRWSGAAFTQLGGLATATYVAVSPRDNRLVLGRTSGVSRVHFSDAGAPETFGANNFVEFAPGDGAEITGLASYQDLILAFKPDRIAVFYGTSTDSSGNPVFNYRTLNGVGSLIPPAVSPEGVYFFDGITVWVTTGGTPRPISAPIEPFLSGKVTVGGVTGRPGFGNERLYYSNGRLYFRPNTTTTGRTLLVYDPKLETWMFYDLQVAGIAQGQNATTAGKVDRTTYWMGSDVTPLKLYRMDPTATTDNGTAVAWSWKSGQYALDAEQRVAITRESSLFGTGTVTLTLSSDRYADQSGSVTLGTAPTPAEGWLQKDQEGRFFQHTLSGSGAATVEALTHNVSTVKPAGIA